MTGFATLQATEDLEIELLLEALFQRFGFDFRGYDRNLLRRKLLALLRQRGLATVSALQEKLLHESGAALAVVRTLAVPSAPLFDRPEEKLYARTQVFATLASDELLAELRDATLPAGQLAEFQAQYEESGGTGRLADYFEVSSGEARLLPRLRERITWAQYSLVTDASFNEFHAIVCRQALADFGPLLRQRVLRLFHDSLALFGVMGIDRELGASDAFAED